MLSSLHISARLPEGRVFPEAHPFLQQGAAKSNLLVLQLFCTMLSRWLWGLGHSSQVSLLVPQCFLLPVPTNLAAPLSSWELFISEIKEAQNWVLVYAKEKVQEVYSKLYCCFMCWSQRTAVRKVNISFSLWTGMWWSLFEVQTWDGTSATLQERQRGRPHTLSLLLGAEQFEICFLLEEFANP